MGGEDIWGSGRGLPGCSQGPSALLLKGLTQERLLFHSYVDKQHNDENAKDSQLQAPWEAVLRVLAREAALHAGVPLAAVLFGDTPILHPWIWSFSVPAETFQGLLGL